MKDLILQQLVSFIDETDHINNPKEMDIWNRNVIGFLMTLEKENQFSVNFDKQSCTDLHPMILGHLKGIILRAQPNESNNHQDSITDNKSQISQGTNKSKNVFVVHGRNTIIRKAVFDFLRSVGIKPIEWSQAIALTKKSSPYIGEILDRAFSEAQAIVILFTPDDLACLKKSLQSVYT